MTCTAAPTENRTHLPIRQAVILFLATGLCVGYVPMVPGTAGSVLGLAAAWSALAPASGHPIAAVAVFAAAFILGCWIAHRAQEILGEHDSPRIVVDEVMGMAATMFLNPLDWIHLLIGFVLFRFFDIAKLPPASFFDREVRGGAGVMLDDLAAAIYANVALRLIAHFIW